MSDTQGFRFTHITSFAAYGGEEGKEGARTPRAPSEGLAALLHFRHHG
ncbi:MAG: hypothetical protein M3Z24_08695 [Chloroflexota bacterium]|nr:hypothetical protein [Chloroflexota bacterium]